MQFSTLLIMVTAAITAQAANNVPERVVFSAPGAKDVVGNGFGCVNIRPAGSGNHNCCVKRIFTDGFTVNINDQGNGGVVTQCSIKGTQGACGPKGVSIKVTPFGTEVGKAPPPTGPQGLPNSGKFSAVDTTQPRTLPKKPKAAKARAVEEPEEDEVDEEDDDEVDEVDDEEE